MKIAVIWIIVCLVASVRAEENPWLTFEGKSGPGQGKHIVLLSGDEEYRSEEALPQLARILAERHGFKCTVLFSLDAKTGEIDPRVTNHEPGLEALDTADLCIMLLRFRAWPDEQMKHFADYLQRGKPIIALRTSTHAFNYPGGSTSPYARFSYNAKEWPGGFGKQVLGETWVAHHGAHKKEATRGVLEPGAEEHPILRGVRDLFVTTDVYTAAPPADAKILVRGQVLTGMTPETPPVEGKKNDPMQPIVWTREWLPSQFPALPGDASPRRLIGGTPVPIVTTTMGAATDLQCEDFRRLLVNATFWTLNLEVPERADVALVGDYQPTMYGFNGHKKGVKPDALK